MSSPLGRSVLIVSVNLVLLVVLLGALEVGARVFFPRELGGVFDDPTLFVDGRSYIVSHPERGFALEPGFTDATQRINAAGFRGPENPADLASRTVILAMGESTTFGWGVGDAETIPVLLNRLLSRQTGRPFWTVNAGVPSYSSSQVRLYLEELLPQLNPELVLVNEFWNDILYSFFNPWSPEFLVRQQPARWEQFLLKHSGLYRAIKLPAPDADAPIAATNEAAVRTYKDNLDAMVRTAEKHGAKIALVLPSFCLECIPEEGMRLRGELQVDRKELVGRMQQFLTAMGEVAEERSVPLLRHTLADPDLAQPNLFLDMAHPTALGNRVMAKDLALALVQEGLVAPGAKSARNRP